MRALWALALAAGELCLVAMAPRGPDERAVLEAWVTPETLVAPTPGNRAQKCCLDGGRGTGLAPNHFTSTM